MLIVVAVAIVAMPAQATLVDVEMTGRVEWNFARHAPLTEVPVGDQVSVTFQVDSDVFRDSTLYSTRGYVIDGVTYTVDFASGVSVQYEPHPWYPPSYQPYFVVRNDDPGADGFFNAYENVDWPYPGVPLNVFGWCGPFESHFDVSYTPDVLESLDILDAIGTYEYDGLTRFYFNLVDCGFEVIGIDFTQMTISLVPEVVPVDIKPESCPNPMNQRSRGKTPVAILGTPDLDVTTIDPASIRLEGVGALKSDFEDVGTPFEPYWGKSDCDYDCNEYDGDGYMDLTVKFSTQEIMDVLGGVQDGECRRLRLTGYFLEEYGGGPIIGEDVVVMVPKATGPVDDRLVDAEEDRGPLVPDTQVGVGITD
jgi:hypothetical protein